MEAYVGCEGFDIVRGSRGGMQTVDEVMLGQTIFSERKRGPTNVQASGRKGEYP